MQQRTIITQENKNKTKHKKKLHFIISLPCNAERIKMFRTNLKTTEECIEKMSYDLS